MNILSSDAEIAIRVGNHVVYPGSSGLGGLGSESMAKTSQAYEAPQYRDIASPPGRVR